MRKTPSCAAAVVISPEYNYSLLFIHIFIMTGLSKEKRLGLAIEAFHKGQFPSKTACAKAFDVSQRTLMTHLNETVSHQHTTANCWKLSTTEEESLKKWILDMDKHSLPLQIANIRHLAQLLLSAQKSKDVLISDKWVSQFIQHHPELQSKYTRQYDYRHAKCEDSELIKGWFDRVQETIQKYDILEQDIYNMDETGFQMGVASTAKINCGSETRNSHAKSIQPGNHKWIIIIIAINAAGSVLSPQIIFAGKKRQSQWYSAIPKEYRISMSDNSWTNDALGLNGFKRCLRSIHPLRLLINITFLYLMIIVVILLLVLIISALRDGLFLYICLHIHLIYFNHWI